MKPAFVRVVLIPALLILGCGVTGLQAQAPSMPGEVVKLPPLIVEEKLPPLHWSYASLPGREVLSLCDADSTEKFMQRDWQLEQWKEALRWFFRAAKGGPGLSPRDEGAGQERVWLPESKRRPRAAKVQ